MPLNEKGLRRVMKELTEYEKSDKLSFTLSYSADNLQTIHAIVRSLDGLYEGSEFILRIKLPDDYPYKPPVISCITPNGRFEAGTNICLSISHFHSETWSPLITIEKVVYSVLSVFHDPTIKGVGSIDTFHESKILQFAQQSKEYNRTHFASILSLEHA